MIVAVPAVCSTSPEYDTVIEYNPRRSRVAWAVAAPPVNVIGPAKVIEFALPGAIPLKVTDPVGAATELPVGLATVTVNVTTWFTTSGFGVPINVIVTGYASTVCVIWAALVANTVSLE